MDFFNDLIHKTLKMEIGMRQPTSSFKYICKKYIHFMYLYIKAFFFLKFIVNKIARRAVSLTTAKIAKCKQLSN